LHDYRFKIKTSTEKRTSSPNKSRIKICRASKVAIWNTATIYKSQHGLPFYSSCRYTRGEGDKVNKNDLCDAGIIEYASGVGQ
jgi:hypothetical protein